MYHPTPWRRRLLWFLPGKCPIFKGERVMFPLFEIAANPTIKLSDIKARRFNIVDRTPRGCVVVTEEEMICHVPEESLCV